MLILKSKKQIAKKFQEWVCDEVLPSIRKKGEFILESYKKKLEEKDKELKNIEFGVIFFDEAHKLKNSEG
jgi:prophage antirepressor-like protein